MDVESRTSSLTEHSTYTVLVTGANSGLGFAICCRTIDEFLFTRPQSQSLHLLFSTRDVKKSQDTERRLYNHLKHTLRQANGTVLGISLLLEKRIKIEGLQCDLTKLITVKALAKSLLSRKQKIDAVIWNAGIGGWKRINWPLCIWQIMTDLVHASIYPEYNICDVGALAPLQAENQGGAESGGRGKINEPRLAQVFTANLFGHYMLTHWLAPLMDANSRIIWISSITAMKGHLSLEDVQGLKSKSSYESSKRLTDMLVLTSELPSTRTYVNSFLATPETQQFSKREGEPAAASTTSQRPRMYVTHPGICGTSIAGLNWFIEFFMFAAFYLARLLGSPWHPVSPYKGSISAVFAAIAPSNQFGDYELREGKGKWGSSTNATGNERVARTEVEGWGFCGKVGTVPNGSVTGTKGRWRGMRETGKEDREDFERQGAKAWREMEELRKEWQERLGPVGLEDVDDV